MKIVMLALLVSAMGIARAEANPAARSGWQSLAENDLRAIHDVVADNHPGPVDPRNRAYAAWLAAGLVEAVPLARQARDYSDYKRDLLFYTNGFRDSHILPFFRLEPTESLWPGFLLRRGGDGRMVVTGGEHDGDALLSCDGVAGDLWQRRALDPFYWNSELPHERDRWLPALLMIDSSEHRYKPRTCLLDHDGRRVTVTLRWTSMPAGQGRALTDRAANRHAPPLGLRRLDGLWFVSIPTFNFQSADEVAGVRAFLAELDRHQGELRRDGFVLDMRGNRGGNSAWGTEVATRLWGAAWVERIERGFDSTVDWRASPANEAAMREQAALAQANGLADAAAYRRQVADLIAAAIRARRPLARQEGAPASAVGPEPERLVSGPVFFLTDTLCDSACLDFADMVRSLPGTVHIGLPTDGDALYIDNNVAELPSGLASLSYSLKVYRHRLRANNQYYTPQIPWPGGEMTDQAVAAWVERLRERR